MSVGAILLIQKEGWSDQRRILIPENLHVLEPGSCPKELPTFRQKLDVVIPSLRSMRKALAVQFEFLVFAALTVTERPKTSHR
jgi:hypothetical protein